MVNAVDWIKRAKSNLAIAKKVQNTEYEIFGGEVFFEELCFELQQCVEKSFKAILIKNDIEFPRNFKSKKRIEMKNPPERQCCQTGGFNYEPTHLASNYS